MEWYIFWFLKTGDFQVPYCWWLKSCTTWDVWNPINNINLNNGIDYQPPLVSRISAINSMFVFLRLWEALLYCKLYVYLGHLSFLLQPFYSEDLSSNQCYCSFQGSIHSQKLTENLKMIVWKMIFLFQGASILRFQPWIFRGVCKTATTQESSPWHHGITRTQNG